MDILSWYLTKKTNVGEITFSFDRLMKINLDELGRVMDNPPKNQMRSAYTQILSGTLGGMWN